MEEPDSPRRIESVVNAFKIVEALEELDGAGVTELAGHLDIAKSTIHIYLQTLLDIGYVSKEGETYTVGLKFLEAGGHARQRSKVYDVGRPKVDRLAEETKDVVTLGVENLCKRVVLYRSEGDKAVHSFYSRFAWTGAHLPLNWTAIGKTILSQKTDNEVEDVIARFGLPEATEHTITNRDVLFEEIERIRDQGYALENEEYKVGSRSIAAPIVRPNGRIAAISVTGPKNRLSNSRIENELVDLVVEYADIISLELHES